MRKSFSVAAPLFWMMKLIYRWIRKKQNCLKRETDRRYEGLWMGPAPKLLGEKELIAGDVLFCGQAKRDKMTEIIQNTTDGAYVHCGIYVGDGKVIHATAKGVRPIRLKRFVADYSYVAVTRSPGANKNRSEKIIKFARRCVRDRVKYNFIGAVLVPLREYWNIRNYYNIRYRGGFSSAKIKPRKSAKRKYFCSEFVVQCYIDCGYVDEEYGYHRPGRWSPSGLAEENFFDFVGFMSTCGLEAVDPADPYINGNLEVLTQEGRRCLVEQELRMDAAIKKLSLAADDMVDESLPHFVSTSDPMSQRE